MTTLTTRPADDAARIRATLGLQTSMAVSAGAGSGKTSVLSTRIVETLLSGVEPSALAGITFTEKAAGELVRRVRDSLEGRLRRAVEGGDHALATRVESVLARFAEVTITTIHSFCRELLRQEAFVADVAPQTTIGDERAIHDLASRAVIAWRSGLRTTAPALWRVLDERTTTAALIAATLTLERHSDYRVVADDRVFDVDVMRQELSQVIVALRAAVVHCKAKDTCLLLRDSQGIVDAVGAAVDAAFDEQRRNAAVLDALLNDLKWPAKNAGRKPDWETGGREAYRAALETFADWRTRWSGAAHGAVVRRLRDEVVPVLSAGKRDEAVASFDDLLVIAAAVLRTHDDARARLSARYQVVLIDEVQDTDPIQAEVALALTAAADGSGPGPGRLFAVGDPRQSIYRFRGADVATFSRLEDEIARSGERHALVANFRSAPGIVHWVNHTFADLPGYVPQVAERQTSTTASTPASTVDPVVLLEGGGDAAGEAADDESADGSEGGEGAEVDRVLGHLQALKDAGATVTDRETGLQRPVRGRDVMVLLPSWGKADHIADRLRAAGHQCVVEGGGAFFERDEVRLLVAAVAVIAEPADTRATALVLRGLFGLSLEQLAAHVAGGGALRCTVPPVQAGPVSDALAVVLRLHRRRGSRSVSGLLDEVLASTRALSVWALLPDGASRSANVDKLLSIVRGLEREERSPLSVTAELLRLTRERKGDKDIDRLDDDGDAIRVTTLFKAKGLEAPIVVVMHATRSTDGVTEIVDHGARTIVVRIKDLEPADWKALVADEKARDLEERRRWMYVAATRARDQLAICRTAPKGKATTLYAQDIARRGLPPSDALPEDGAIWSPDDVDPTAPGPVQVRVRHAAALLLPPGEAEVFPGVDAAVDALLDQPTADALGDDDGEAWARADKQRTRAAERGCVRWRSATDEGARAAAAVAGTAPPGGDVGGAVVVVGTVASSARVGQVVHEVMERLELSQPASALKLAAPALVTALSRRAGLSAHEEGKAIHIVDEILNHPKLALARQAPELWREVPFTFPAGARGIVAGTIDLCFPVDVERRRWVVFDWKSSTPPPGSVKRVRYEAQLEQYAKALLHTFGDVDIVEKAIVGPWPQLGPATTSDDTLADAPVWLRDDLAAFMARGGPAPTLDWDLELDLPATAGVAFVDAKVAVFVEGDDDAQAALRGRGWRLCASLDEAAALLGLGPVVDEDLEATTGAVDAGGEGSRVDDAGADGVAS